MKEKLDALHRDLGGSRGDAWIGVDFDGTLATYDGWRGALHVGEPIEPMMHRVRVWLATGTTVKIFTARASRPEQVLMVQAWLLHYGLPKLEITDRKDHNMIELWDDRAIHVEKNTGRIVG